MWNKNVGSSFFRFVTIHAFNRWTERKALAIPCVALHAVTRYKQLSYRRENALQGALVMAKSGRLELGHNISADIIDLPSTTVT